MGATKPRPTQKEISLVFTAKAWLFKNIKSNIDLQRLVSKLKHRCYNDFPTFHTFHIYSLSALVNLLSFQLNVTENANMRLAVYTFPKQCHLRQIFPVIIPFTTRHENRSDLPLMLLAVLGANWMMNVAAD